MAELADLCGFFIQRLIGESSDKIVIFTQLLRNTAMVENLVWIFRAQYDMRKEGSLRISCHAVVPYCCTVFLGACSNSDHARSPSSGRSSRSYWRQNKINLWRDLVKLLSITEETIRERYRADRKCCNLGCPTRSSGSQEIDVHSVQICLLLRSRLSEELVHSYSRMRKTGSYFSVE
ncbi:hypothetical protein CPB84DRAFT_709831 [Gymnopilus junonius]|uniref:Uncharacterized protein n=1 Tax=Gymnopilus junonius TaxID=109634 RepID=A0A9P5NTE9_GYMJU|nr:hypothetical protein CPB84DRAFT_709831 [Gymnopilus junonius]